ncbi:TRANSCRIPTION FACTOR BHLH123-LIKE ISOFORM X1 [Salix purpurea]|uniref:TRANSCRIPTION FACTOR BHLH123-LIKE ISOFORM X1 n=1 Tax=Salix purpurea TaxID=77065 RepID=A0A9Q1AGF9_SALPP|nr:TRANSCRIPTION FACTOR BHLH123-LIKE ISOFORM X1 [Salix purpurea]
MADEYTSTNWWASSSSSRNRFDSTGSSSTASGLTSLGSFAWPTEMVDVKGRSSMETVSVSDSSAVFHDSQKLQQGHDSSADLHMMGLGLPSQAIDWNQALLRGDKSESSFRSMLQDNLSSSTNYQQETGIGSSQAQWRSERVFAGVSAGDSSMNEFKQMNRGFSSEQPQFSPHGSSSDSTVTGQGLQSSFPMDSSGIYGSPSTMLQGLLGSDSQAHQSSFENRSMSYSYGANYGVSSNDQLLPWSKTPQFLRNSPPKQPPHNQLHLSNNAPFWNASSGAMSDVRPSFFHSMQPQFTTSNFDEKPKNISEVRDSNTSVKKSGGEAAAKRPRNETPSPSPAFKVRKEKMGDRITALQQLVSPFGKTDTASVLSEAIEYIKFLHEQVTVMSAPYMKNGAPIHHQQSSDKSKDSEGQKQDLRSRGLCLVPVSSTFPVTHETTVDFWTPTFGGTFR